jgi:hypothetical protein
MASIVVSGDTSGAITIAAPAVAGTNTLTLPASTGTLVVTGGAQTIEFADGTVSAPSITNSGDTNTGIYFPAADTIAFTEGGVESMRVDASGNLGIGTASPLGRLDVNGTSTVAFVRTTDTTSPTLALFVNGGSNGVGTISVDNGGIMTFDTGSTGAGQAERMRIDSSGNVGIGTSSPSVKLHVSTSGAGVQDVQWLNNSQAVGAGVGSRLVFTGTSSNNGLAAIDGAFAGATTADGGYMVFNTRAVTSGALTERMRIDSSGNVGIGTSSPGFGLHLYRTSAANASMALESANANTYALLQFKGSGARTFEIGTGSSGTGSYNGVLYFFDNTANAERMRLDSDGNVLVGTTSTSPSSGVGTKIYPTGFVRCVSAADANTTENWSMYSTGAANYRFYVGWGGTIYATSTTITSLSDERVKENIADIDVGLDAVMALKPRRFDWKAGKGKDIKGDRGFIAQEFETVFPEMIDTWKDPAPEGEDPYKAVNADLIPILVKAIQEQQAIITQLQADVAELKGAK